MPGLRSLILVVSPLVWPHGLSKAAEPSGACVPGQEKGSLPLRPLWDAQASLDLRALSGYIVSAKVGHRTTQLRTGWERSVRRGACHAHMGDLLARKKGTGGDAGATDSGHLHPKCKCKSPAATKGRLAAGPVGTAQSRAGAVGSASDAPVTERPLYTHPGRGTTGLWFGCGSVDTEDEDVTRGEAGRTQGHCRRFPTILSSLQTKR